MDYEESLCKNGYAFIPGTWYEKIHMQNSSMDENTENEIKHILHQYGELIPDPYSPGSRLRAYAQCRINGSSDLFFGHFEPYLQTKAYNPDTGGIVRSYPLISTEVLENELFQLLVTEDIRFVRKYSEIGDPGEAIIGIHLFRYFATPSAPAFSSPVWLHKDDEDVVFIHLLSLSDNAMGGDNIIATDGRHIELVMRLEKPLDTFVVNHAKLHAVTPIWCKEIKGQESHCTRDIILVTFQRRK